MAELRKVSCTVPAGENPARISAGAPGITPPEATEYCWSKRDVKILFWGRKMRAETSRESWSFDTYIIFGYIFVNYRDQGLIYIKGER